jgi:hypothetical protein
MSALPPKADIGWRPCNVRFVPIADIAPSHSITSSARPISVLGMLMPSALAVFRLMYISNLDTCWTGRSAGLSPLRTRPVCWALTDRPLHRAVRAARRLARVRGKRVPRTRVPVRAIWEIG